MQLTRGQIKQFAETGCLALESWFSADEVALLKAETERECARDLPGRVLEKNGAVRTIFAAHKRNETFARLTRLEKMAGAASQLLESEVYVHQFKINAKRGLDGEQWEWHQDYLYWKKEDCMPQPQVLSAVVFLSEVNDFNGPLLVIPGSHHLGTLDLETEQKFAALDAADAWKPTLTADLKYKIGRQMLARILEDRQIEAVTGAPGLVLFFHGNVLHASAGNMTPEDRLSVFVSYNCVANALHPMESPRPDFISERNFTPTSVLPDTALLAPLNGSSARRAPLAATAN